MNSKQLKQILKSPITEAAKGRFMSIEELEQIKAELEAWEVINEEFIIKPYYQVNGKYPTIMIRHQTEDDEFCRRGVTQEKYNIIKKALEVKNNENN